MKVIVINGPNLNMLGTRKPEVYGSKTIMDLEHYVREFCVKNNIEVGFYQSNHEGDIIDKIQSLHRNCYGIVLNAGAFTHYSYAIRDAIESVSTPVVEVHISDVNNREPFRKTSVISDVCFSSVCGLGFDSYIEGIKRLCNGK